MTEIVCGLDGCEYTHTAESTWCEHSWSDKIQAQTVANKPRTVTVFAVVNDRHREPNELALTIETADADQPTEVWLTISEAERLHYILGSAMRRLIAFQPAWQNGGAR